MVFLLAVVLLAQNYTQRGFLETRFTLYPQKVANDSARSIGEALVRYEGFYKPIPNLEISGAVDLRIDTHHQVERRWRLGWDDRELQRPSASVRSLRALYNQRGLTIEAGKQFVRWGKTDIVTPSDRFAPRDFLTVLNNEFIATSGIRATLERGSNTIDAVWAPRFTPSRIPLADQRWFSATLPVGKTDFPGAGEAGLRFSHAGLVEYALFLYHGFNHAPAFELKPPTFTLSRFYPKIRVAGADAAVALKWFTLKMEGAYFDSADSRSDDYLQYVLQVERQAGEWSFVGGYAGEVVGERGSAASFDPDRGLTRTLIGRADYTIDASRSVASEVAIRQNGEGAWIRFEYSQAFGQHWRTTAGLGVIRGTAGDFLGQYRRNSNGVVVLRYSF